MDYIWPQKSQENHLRKTVSKAALQTRTWTQLWWCWRFNYWNDNQTQRTRASHNTHHQKLLELFYWRISIDTLLFNSCITISKTSLLRTHNMMYIFLSLCKTLGSWSWRCVFVYVPDSNKVTQKSFKELYIVCVPYPLCQKQGLGFRTWALRDPFAIIGNSCVQTQETKPLKVWSPSSTFSDLLLSLLSSGSHCNPIRRKRRRVTRVVVVALTCAFCMCVKKLLYWSIDQNLKWEPATPKRQDSHWIVWKLRDYLRVSYLLSRFGFRDNIVGLFHTGKKKSRLPRTKNRRKSWPSGKEDTDSHQLGRLIPDVNLVDASTDSVVMRSLRSAYRILIEMMATGIYQDPLKTITLRCSPARRWGRSGLRRYRPHAQRRGGGLRRTLEACRLQVRQGGCWHRNKIGDRSCCHCWFEESPKETLYK